MVQSVANLNRDEIVARLETLVGQERVCTDKAKLREASVDRFKKYTAVHDIFDGPIPATIVNASSAQQVADVLAFANTNRINVVPRTGRTGTEGGLETVVEDTIVLDGSNMDEIILIDPVNMQATAQCGVPLQVLEDALREQGFTTGHSPQSKPIAQMGGLTATRSIGQLSTLYGGIEDMVVGLEAVFPDGTISRIKNVPVGRPVLTSATSSSATRAHSASSPRSPSRSSGTCRRTTSTAATWSMTLTPASPSCAR